MKKKISKSSTKKMKVKKEYKKLYGDVYKSFMDNPSISNAIDLFKVNGIDVKKKLKYLNL